MFKAIIGLTRSPDQSLESFIDWWTVQHAPLARQLPRLRKAVFNVISESSEDDAPDGFAELWFDNREDFDAAYASEIGQAVAADSLSNVAGRVRYIVEEHLIFDLD